MTTGLDTAAIIDLWEEGQGCRPFERAVQVLARGGTEAPADLPLPERDRALLALRRATFGRDLDLLADCPACGATQELALRTGDLDAVLRRPAPPLPGGGGIVPRDPTTRDLAMLCAAEDPASRLRACVAGREDLAPDLAEALDRWIEARLADSEIAVNLTCADCGAGWAEILDVPACIWAELEGAARRALRDVADLAGAFGWSEAAILELGPARRRAYLDLARAG